MDPINVHQNDSRPSLYFHIYDEDNDVWVDLSGATTVVTAKFRASGTATVLETITCDKMFDGGASGWVKMEWPTDALDVDVGRYEIEVSVSFDGEIQTANKYYFEGAEDDDDDILPIRVKEEF